MVVFTKNIVIVLQNPVSLIIEVNKTTRNLTLEALMNQLPYYIKADLSIFFPGDLLHLSVY